MRRHLVFLLFFINLISFPVKSAPQGAYLLYVFAAQHTPFNRAELSHTFATLVRLPEDREQEGRLTWQALTISWLPRTLEIRPLGAPEPGANFSLASTLRWAVGDPRVRLSVWGPYEVGSELFRRAKARAQYLRSGDLDYVMLDRKYRPAIASNCIHAVSDVDVDLGYLDTGTARGEEASWMVVNHLSRWMVQPTHQYLYSSVYRALGLPQYPIVQR